MNPAGVDQISLFALTEQAVNISPLQHEDGPAGLNTVLRALLSRVAQLGLPSPVKDRWRSIL
ncbi:MAG: hypothetical protein PVI08_06415 [Gammaproteobacteria bacterium]